MSEPGDWPRGALPLGPSVYEEAMRPIYYEAVWRERNFYKAEDSVPAQPADPADISQPSTGIIETVTGGIGNFFAPNGQVNWWKLGTVGIGFMLIAYIVGRR